jgi:sirohydrochlorin cobaltochelatase
VADQPPPLIGLAHGSRHPGVQRSIAELMAATHALGGMLAVGAFLDLTDPDLTSVAVGLAHRGYRRAVIVPLLFTEAFHATIDAPDATRKAAETSGVELVIADILGTGDDLLEVVRASMHSAGIGDVESILLVSVGSSDDGANEAVQCFAHRLSQGRPGPVAVAFGTRSPRPAEVLANLPLPTAIVPLFLSPGLLLDPLAALATDRGLVMMPPLGHAVAALLVDRYRRARVRAVPSPECLAD